MDTTAIVTTVTHTSVFSSVQQSLEPIQWLLLFLGWIMYWLKSLNTARQNCNKQPFIGTWWWDNCFEIPSSAVACLVLAIMAKQVPTDIMDMKGMLSVFLVGYSSSSILNGLITSVKPAFKKPDSPQNP